MQFGCESGKVWVMKRLYRLTAPLISPTSIVFISCGIRSSIMLVISLYLVQHRCLIYHVIVIGHQSPSKRPVTVHTLIYLRPTFTLLAHLISHHIFHRLTMLARYHSDDMMRKISGSSLALGLIFVPPELPSSTQESSSATALVDMLYEDTYIDAGILCCCKGKYDLL